MFSIAFETHTFTDVIKVGIEATDVATGSSNLDKARLTRTGAATQDLSGATGGNSPADVKFCDV